ncbi:MAG: hypothetical protein Q9227_000686 [Pyrenula ochraceoflavens]
MRRHSLLHAHTCFKISSRRLIRHRPFSNLSTRPTTLLSKDARLLQLSSSLPHNYSNTCRRAITSLLSSLSPSSSPSPLTISTTQHTSAPPDLLYQAISSIDSYPTFLPFLTSSVIHSRSRPSSSPSPTTSREDSNTAYPTLATLTISFHALTERFTSLVHCDPTARTVEAWSGTSALDSWRSSVSPTPDTIHEIETALARANASEEETLFEHLYTKWKVGEAEQGKTRVELRVEASFKNPLYNQLLRATEGMVADKMVRAFERRVEELEREGRR